jgi:hypothetical protein
MNCLRKPSRPMPTGAKNEEGRPQGQPSSELLRGGLRPNLTPRSCAFLMLSETPWSKPQLAYFAGCTKWTYLNTPFLLAHPGLLPEERSPGAHYIKGYEEVSGIMFPTKRRIFPRQAAGTASPEPLVISIDTAPCVRTGQACLRGSALPAGFWFPSLPGGSIWAR